MRKLFYLFILAIFLVGCGLEEESETLQGVGQGNGISADLNIASDDYNFKMSYDRNLSVIKNGERIYEINNENLIDDDHKLSKLEFEIIENPRIETIQELKDAVSRYNPERSFALARYNNFEVVTSEVKTEDEIERQDYIFISEGVYVRANTKAYQEGSGIEKVSPIIKTIMLADHTPPYLLDLKLNKSKFFAGEELTLKLEGIDNVSGIAEGCCSGIFLKEQPHNIFKNLDNTFGQVKKTGQNKFVVANFPINQYAKSGIYTIESFAIRDNAGNRAILQINNEYPEFYKMNGRINTKIEVLEFEIMQNDLMDIKHPEVLNISLKKNSFKAGEDLTIELTAKDDVSGIQLSCCGAVSLEEHPVGLFVDSATNFGRVNRKENDVYEVINFPINKYAKSGEYTIKSFSIQDNAGNKARLEVDSENWGFYKYQNGEKTNLRILRFWVDQIDKEDFHPPVINKLILSKNEFTPGENLEILFEGLDDVSGIQLDCCATVFLKEHPNNVFRNSGGINGRVKKTGEGKYKMGDMQISEFADRGEYTVERIYIKDNAKNKARLEIDPDNTMYYRYENGKETQIKVLNFRIK
ncbi:MAG: hypothetical protein OXB84_01745 [Halobacteriovoraceae bacterium]|nr:hypothetical protein [Halobacteriovoraceae bacterium]